VYLKLNTRIFLNLHNLLTAAVKSWKGLAMRSKSNLCRIKIPKKIKIWECYVNNYKDYNWFYYTL